MIKRKIFMEGPTCTNLSKQHLMANAEPRTNPYTAGPLRSLRSSRSLCISRGRCQYPAERRRSRTCQGRASHIQDIVLA